MTVRKSQQQESYSSVDSSDSNDNQSKSLFELCILKGMYKTKEPGARAQQMQEQPIVGSSSVQSNPSLKQFDSLPVQLPSSGQVKRQRHHHHHHHHRERERERKDEKLLQECINTGISKKINAVPKNVLATSAAALEPCHPMAATTSASALSTAAPDVEQKAHATSNPQQQSSTHPSSHILPNPIDAIATVTDTVRSPAAPNQGNGNASQNGLETATGSKDLDSEDRSSDESNQSFIMETMVRLDSALNETCISGASEKHKDPDLMLKSVERLTMEFVTSAEQLRSSSHNHSSSNSHKNNSSNNTWNESTCPNDVSFPSVSQTAPVLASLSLDEDATEARSLHELIEITPTNEQQPESLEGETDTLVNGHADSYSGSSGGLNFQLGGQVQNAGVRLEPQRLLFNGTSASIMTNSTMIAFEARALAENLLQPAATDDDTTEMTFSLNSLDLDNIRPPSGMESLNSCYQDHSQPSSLRQAMPSKSPRFARKMFPANLVARRALGHLAGSAESVNSSCNLLDNIKPPSLMDELLDSMISVDSIQSEVADGEQDCSMATTISVSNYETAACDDQTMTVLQSCFDEDEDATMNDYSSAESTPKHGSTPSPNRRSLTPKDKRRLTKDRFKTYTIATSCEMEAPEANETLQIEIVEAAVPVATPSPRANGRRRGSAERYKTQLIECPLALIQPQPDDCPSEQLSSIRAMMQQFTFITDINIGHSQETCESTDHPEDAGESPECDQNSETESCDGQEPDQLPPPPSIVDLRTSVVKPTTLEPATAVKLVRGRKKPAYVSPYSMQSQRNSNNAAPSKKKTLSPTIAKRSLVPGGSGVRLPAKKKPTPPPEPAPARLERQGTFVKDEPTNSNVQVPVVETKPAQTSPTHRASKLPTKKGTASGGSPSKAGSPKRIPLAPARRMTPQRANTSLRLAAGKSHAASRVVSGRVSSTTPPSRSNSNLNGSSAAAAAAAKINHAQSRIANIWKRVDEAKTKQSSSNLRTQKTKSSNMLNANGTKPTLLRSSTFDNTPSTAGGVKSKLPVVGARK